jgi:superfamily II DNA or RNA helicase
MADLLEVMRKACLSGIWTQGVKLSRQGAVTRAGGPSELVFRVRAPGNAIAPTVTLYPDDGEWSCDCDGKADPCAHAVAAAIQLGQGDVAVASEAAAAPKAAARLVYRLAMRERVLTVARFVVHPEGREEKVSALASELARGRLPAGLEPTHEDLTIDRLLGVSRKDSVPLDRLSSLLSALASCKDVSFAGKPIKVSAEPSCPRATVEDAPNGGFRLTLARDPNVSEVVAMGVVRCGDTLRGLAETVSTGYFLERLPLVRLFSREQQSELATQVIPELERKLPLEVTTRRLPRANREVRPRIAMDLSHQGHTLSVLPTLVYGDPPLLRVDGEQAVALGDEAPIRRRDEERELLRRLRDSLHLVPGRRVDLDGPEAVRFAAKLRDWQRSVGDASYAKVFEERPLNARLLLRGDTFDVVFERASGDEKDGEPKRADAATVLQAFRDGLELVPLDGGGWAPLPASWLAQHGHRVADLMAARTAEKRLPLSALPELGELCEALDEPKPPDLERLAPLLDGFSSMPRATLPEGLNAELRAYQQVGVDWLSFLKTAGLGAVLADDMGLGKTLQTICVLGGRALVVCPKSVVYNWAEEIARFRPGLRTAIYHGEKREIDARADVTLTTYAILRLDIERLKKSSWDVIVLDEAQAIKNADSQTARAAFELEGEFRVALSGTPVENRLEELWSIVHFVNPGLLGGRSSFQSRYSSPIASGDAAAAARLRAKVRPFVLRRLKRDVLPELPPRTDAVLHVELDEVERSVYDAVRAATRKELLEQLEHGVSNNALLALEALLRLRQAACHSDLVPGQTAERSSKVDRLLEALEEMAAEGHKALVFSQWTGLLDRVEPHLQKAGIRFTRLDGTTRDRASVVREFQADDGPEVMLVSLKAGGTGLNLTAADYVFLLDPWWNPAVEDQAADRAHRIGQDRPVMVYRMVAKDTVEERILALQERKRQLADAALGEADQASPITRAELLALLE